MEISNLAFAAHQRGSKDNEDAAGAPVAGTPAAGAPAATVATPPAEAAGSTAIRAGLDEIHHRALVRLGHDRRRNPLNK
ncbi:MAG TPA: hypothetical protein VGP06_09205 [Janthinobacterium sp.]|nr:hypothetical protein [Janthinobacterium sp.]